MPVPKYPICSERMVRNGKTAAGTQRWKCTSCGATSVDRIDNEAKRLDEFPGWLLSKRRMSDMPGAGSGLEKARKRVWPDAEVQRCTFHAFCQVKRYTTTRPSLPAGAELYGIATELLGVEDTNAADGPHPHFLSYKPQRAATQKDCGPFT